MDINKLDEHVKNKVDELTRNYFERSTGGNNRMWSKRYTSMLNQWRLIENSPSTNEDVKYGYKLCLSHFHNFVNND